MIPEAVQLLAIALILVALAAATVAVVVARGTRRASQQLRKLSDSLDARTERLPIAFASARADMAERTATIEHAAWLVGRLDSQIDAANARMAAQRVALDDLRNKMERSRARVERLKSSARLIIRALELRRTLL